MNSEEFVSAIERYVVDAAITNMIAVLKAPPGRRVTAPERAVSNWYNGLAPEGIECANRVIESAVREAVFGLLTVLDGARTIDDEAGTFELIYSAPGVRRLLNDPASIGLHDLFNDQK